MMGFDLNINSIRYKVSRTKFWLASKAVANGDYRDRVSAIPSAGAPICRTAVDTAAAGAPPSRRAGWLTW